MCGVVELIGSTVRAAESAWDRSACAASACPAWPRSGVLVDACGDAAPVIAWFDHRGDHELSRQAGNSRVCRRFERTTGLRWSSQASIAKLLWLRTSGYQPGPASTWMSVPEWIVFALGGDPIREPSLASRTGLIDQGTGGVWPDALAVAGLSAQVLPDERPAGVRHGYVRRDGVASCAADAVLTVAGHDHPVAAIGVGAAGADELFNSSGTADVLARSIPGRWMRPSARTSSARLVHRAAQCCRTQPALAGSWRMLLRQSPPPQGGIRPGQTAANHASLDIGELPRRLQSPATATRDGVMMRIRTGSPARLDGAARAAARARLLLDDIEKIVGPTRGHRRRRMDLMASVRGQAAAIDAMSFSAVVQPVSPRPRCWPLVRPGRRACCSPTSSSTKERNDPR
jgi:hypothetical protein